MSRQTTVARVEEIAERVGQSEGLEIVEVELKGTGRNQLLRIFIDKPGGVTHGDCEKVSQRVGELVEADGILPDQYTLEVSSPGIERKLKKPADFARFEGKKVRVVMRNVMKNVTPVQPAEKAAVKTRLVEGTIAGTDESGVLIDVAAGERMHIPFEAIDRANLKFEW